MTNECTVFIWLYYCFIWLMSVLFFTSKKCSALLAISAYDVCSITCRKLLVCVCVCVGVWLFPLHLSLSRQKEQRRMEKRTLKQERGGKNLCQPSLGIVVLTESSYSYTYAKRGKYSSAISGIQYSETQKVHVLARPLPRSLSHMHTHTLSLSRSPRLSVSASSCHSKRVENQTLRDTFYGSVCPCNIVSILILMTIQCCKGKKKEAVVCFKS